MDTEGKLTTPTRQSELSAFAHLNSEKSGDYRAILEAFVRSREEFMIHLRPSELLVELRDAGMELSTIEARLQQLSEWGNLLSTRDSAEVTTVEDFYRPRYLYQLSAEGEAAEAALEFFYTQIDRPGELQVSALGDILVSLEEIYELLAAAPLDEAKLYSAFNNLTGRFEELTNRVEVVRPIARPHSYRPVRARLMHTVPQIMVSLGAYF